MMMDDMGGMMVWMLLWGLIGLAMLVLIIVAIIWLIRHMLAGPTSRSDPAQEELRRRYAAGDIDHEEYQHRRAELRER
ncbi:SHOCT domain-containing protein [Allosaccharopolyspora coralli]|uniref:SHOCT domain-containing protein n=1 Tax=Allosaccharopolyspora coralli TaxID=2665642 RepID=A0A5Q3QFD8_9PSEU|nr:SHOCT domain-containing protein [Allosaccharopolyspora coralli]QGK70245.1 SHOCT domain-containing protein [Allosaccharopolyspora coralli]